MSRTTKAIDYALSQHRKNKVEEEKAVMIPKAISEENNNTKVANISSKRIPYPDVVVNGGKIYQLVSSDKKKVIGNEIKIEDISESIDKNQVTYLLSFSYKGTKKSVEIPREKLGDKRGLIKEITQHGADAYEHNITGIIKHLVNQEEMYNKPITKVHHQVGWDKTADKLVFKHFKGVGIRSRYRGKLDIEPKGSHEAWEDMIMTEVIGHTPLELALTIGFSSALVGMIGRKVDTRTLVVHIYGDSTEGKTTAAMLAVSPWGNPDSSVTGLVNDWNATSNAFFALLRNNSGLPVVFDESSMSDIGNFSNMIYKLASGREKNRMNKEAELEEQSKWETTTISTGEHALTIKANENAGIEMRIQEIGNITWTKDATNSDNIKQSVLKHYGHAGKEFVAGLLEMGEERVLAKYNEHKALCKEAIKNKDKFVTRISKKLAMLTTTAELVNDILGLDLNIEAIIELLVKVEDEKVINRDIGAKAYMKFLEQVEIHDSKFITDYGKPFGEVEVMQRYNEVWGKKEYYSQEEGKGLKEINIFPQKFKDIMQECGFEDYKIILKKWQDKGLLDHEADRLSRRKNITDGRKPVYVIKVREEY
ncbi:protein of unknown function [Orenia metallireducens]|uniref:DUF927 domain-containing protein n=1 Tax=Orenia metallireducens TaxID=1413210 RepID=A0A285GTD4_9FIRM|nr:DUF927 domain-containing protein [Orenia metallireducens]SNY26910.1 protein of unknown function [Orenia metallireducens]